MDRRNLLTMFGMGVALTACAGGKLPELPVNVGITLPPEIKAIIDDAQIIVAKVESISHSVPNITGLIDKAKGAISDLTSGKGDAKGIVSGLVSVLGTVAGLIPPPYNMIAMAVETLLPVIGSLAGMKMAARRPTGMTPEMARKILAS